MCLVPDGDFFQAIRDGRSSIATGQIDHFTKNGIQMKNGKHVEADLDATLKDLQTDYVDSFVIHWPMACPSTGKNVTLRTNGIYPAHQSQSNHFH